MFGLFDAGKQIFLDIETDIEKFGSFYGCKLKSIDIDI